MIDIEAIRQRCEAATKGPWGLHGGPGMTDDGRGMCAVIGSSQHTEHLATFNDYLLPMRANRDFVIHARTDIPALLEEVARLKRTIANLLSAEAKLDALQASATSSLDKAKET